MAITIIYTTGNGYSCSCCRNSDESNEDFDTEDAAVAACCDLAARAGFDFSVDRILGAENPDDLEKRIEAAVAARKTADELAGEIQRLKEDNAKHRAWLNNVGAETQRRLNAMSANDAKLIELKAMSPWTLVEG